MKANSRRRVLISSMAMLLVALVALSTATYAWFTQNTTSTANAVYAKTVKASSLEISRIDKAWGTSVQYKQGTSEDKQIMFPVSSANGTDWYTAIAAADDASTAKSDSVEKLTGDDVMKTTGATYVFKDQLNIRNSGTDGTITGITVQVTNNAATDSYTRIALVPCLKSDANAYGTELTTADIAEGKAYEGVYTADQIGFANSIYDVDGVSYSAYLPGEGGAITTATITPHALSTAISIPDLDAEEAVYYNLYVWFEGQDAQCYDGNAAQELDNLTFTVSGTPA